MRCEVAAERWSSFSIDEDMPFPENSTVIVAAGAWADESNWKEVILPVGKQELQVVMF
jgi:hypothetical protein